MNDTEKDAVTEMKEWNAADKMNEVRSALLHVNLELVAKMQLSLDIRLNILSERGRRKDGINILSMNYNLE